MARHLPRPLRADAAPARGACRARPAVHHPRHRRPASSAQAGDGGNAARRQALGAAGDDGADPALEGSRPGAAAPVGRGYRRFRGRTRARGLCGLPGAAAHAERRGFRGSSTAHDRDPAHPAGRAGAVSPGVPLHPGRRIPGHQPGAVSLAAAAGAGASQHLLRRRRRPVDLFVARRGSREHPALREGFPKMRGSCGWNATTARRRRSWPLHPG